MAGDRVVYWYELDLRAGVVQVVTLPRGASILSVVMRPFPERGKLTNGPLTCPVAYVLVDPRESIRERRRLRFQWAGQSFDADGWRFVSTLETDGPEFWHLFQDTIPIPGAVTDEAAVAR